MHFVNHNFTDIDFETKHMSRIEKTIYFDLRSLYLSEESPIDGSDMELLERRLSVIDDAEKQALAFVLKDKFKKAGKYYKRATWDKILKDYKWGNKNKGNAIGNDVTQGVTLGNAARNVTCNDDDAPMSNAERTRKARQDKRNMINDLANIGVSVDKGISAADLRELHAKHIDDIQQCNASNVTTDVTKAVTPSNDPCNAGNAKNTAITKNHKPITNNHKPVSERDAHTNTGEGIVDNFADVVDNFKATTQPTETSPTVTEPVITQPPVNQPATKAEQVRSQNADDIENWEAPTIDEMRGELFRAGKLMQLTDDQYSLHIEDFKAYYSEQAQLGRPVNTDANRKTKLRKWLIGEVDKQAVSQARQEKAKGTFNIDNEDWSGTTANNPTQSNSDMPDVFHPSHSTGTTDASQPLFLNGLKREPFTGMTTDESYALVDRHTQIGESRVAAYDRLLADMQEAV